MAEPYLDFEREFAAWAGVGDAVGCASGTAALHLALECIGLPPGSKVAVPDFTMVACARAVTLAGMTPVFVDCRRGDLLLDLDLLDEACSREGGAVRAVMPVHVYGRRCDMDGLIELATKYDLCVIEDLAEAHGVPPHPGSDAACWSFYRNKVVAGEEGGAVWFRNAGAAGLARKLRSLGFTDAHDYHHVPRGHNYRLSNLHAAAALAGLAGVDGALAERRALEAAYDAECPPAWRMPRRLSPWVYDLRVPGLAPDARADDGGPSRQDRAVRALQAAGLAARHGFKPMSLQWEYFGVKGVRTYRHASQALAASREVIYLPLQPGTSPEHEGPTRTARRAFEVLHAALDRTAATTSRATGT